jgi:hypothetical protein
MNNKTITIPVYIGLFLLITGVSYFAFDSLLPVGNSDTASGDVGSKSSENNKQQAGNISTNAPRTEVCPINGAKYSKDAKNIWSQRRPLIAMIENHSDSRPQSGLQNADIIYEAVAEGGITRFMGVFYCGATEMTTDNKYDIGPVRSARTYFLDLASEYSDYPLYNHVGGANCSGVKDPKTGKEGACTTDKRAQAIEQIASYGWNDQGTWGDMSEFSLSYKACRREPERTGTEKATEHTMYCSTKELWNVAANRGLTNITAAKKKQSWDKNYRPWVFTQKDQANSTPAAANISFDFWGDKAYAVSWKYDASKNVYLRSNGGQPHIDFNTKAQLNTKNIVIQFVKETKSIDQHAHNLYGVIGTGDGVLLQNGQKTEITWSKANRLSRTIFKDKSGKEVNFVPGQIWIEILPIGSKVNYEGSVQS